MKDLSLKKKVAAGIVIMGLILVSLSAVVFLALQNSQQDAEIVDVAGRQRMLTQAMAKSVLGYTQAKNTLGFMQTKVQELDAYVTQMRAIYTKTVIGPAKQQGLGISMQPGLETHPAVPFPATFTRLVNEQLSSQTEGRFQLDVVAEDPVNPQQGLKDAVDQEAFAALRNNPKQLFFKAVEGKQDNHQGLHLRFYTADLASVEACASCHAGIKQTPFKVGDLLGIRRYSLHFADDVAAGRQRLEPSLAEYETAKAVFTQTLAALKSGGEYPADLKLASHGYYAGSQDPEVLDKIAETEALWAEFEQAVASLTTAQAGSEEFWSAQKQIMEGSNRLRALSNDLTLMFKETAEKNQAYIQWAVIGMLVAAILGLLGIFALIARTIVAPVQRLVAVADDIAGGDLTRSVPYASGDEVGQLGQSLNNMAKNLNSMVAQIADSAGQLAAASTQLRSSTRQMAEDASTQSQQTEIMATAVEEVGQTSHDMARNTSEASGAADMATEMALKGGEVVRQTVAGMGRISEAVQSSAQTVESLAKSSEKIGAIVAVIDDIANQTNLLALNAAIEAARAGEQGRGFAVVADEVRALANRTTGATREISEMIKSIQDGTQAAVASMGTGKKEVEQGGVLAQQAGDALEQIVQVVEGLSGQITQIATATEEQSSVVQEITRNVVEVSDISKKTQTAATEGQASAEQVAGLAGDLQGLIGRFKI